MGSAWAAGLRQRASGGDLLRLGAAEGPWRRAAARQSAPWLLRQGLGLAWARPMEVLLYQAQRRSLAAAPGLQHHNSDAKPPSRYSLNSNPSAIIFSFRVRPGDPIDPAAQAKRNP
jgi:hypothetical protein